MEYVAVKSVEKFRRRKVLNEVSLSQISLLVSTIFLTKEKECVALISNIFFKVRIFHNLKNRHILKFYNWYETRNHLWIIFEYCAGGDLL